MLRGIIFDLDGTLVDSQLDFGRIRRDLNLPPGAPVLEAIEAMEPEEARRCWEILDRHELGGAKKAVPMPGVCSFLEQLCRRKLPLAVVTRNSRRAAMEMLSRFQVDFSPILSREDGPIKPDPWAIHQICQAWGVRPGETAVIGDFHFDIEAGRNAGALTVFFTRDRPAKMLAGAEQADLILDSFEFPQRLLAWIDQST